MIISKIKEFSNWILLGVIALLPIFFLPVGLISIDPFKQFIVFTIATIFSIGLVISKIKKDSFNFSTHMFGIASLVLLLSSIGSTIFSNNSYISLFGRQIGFNSLIGIVSLIAFLYVVYIYALEQEFKDKLLITIYFSTVATTVLNILFVIIPFLPSLGFFTATTTNTVGSWYDLGLFALCTAFLSVFVYQFLGHVKIYKIVSLIGIISGMLLVVIINAPLIFVFAIVFSLAYIIVSAIKPFGQDPNNRISYGSIAIFIISTLFILIGSKTGYFVNSFLQIQSLELRPSVYSTLEVTKQTIIHESIIHKIFGVGLDRFDTAWFLYRPADVNLSAYWDTSFRYGFSTLLTYGVTQGIVGVLAILFFLITSIYYSIKLLLLSIKQKEEYFTGLFIVFGNLYFTGALLFYTPSFILIVLYVIFLSLLISKLVEGGLIKFKKVSILKSPRISFVYILVLIIMLVGLVYITYIQTSQYISRFVFERASIKYSFDQDVTKLITRTEKANFIFASDVYLRTLTDIGLMQIQTLLQSSTLTQEQIQSQFSDMLKIVVQYAQGAVLYDSQSYVNRINLLNIYKNLTSIGVSQAGEQARMVIRDTMNIAPNNPTLYLEEARIYSMEKNYDSAFEYIKKALETKSNYVDAVFLLSQIQVAKGETDKAIESIKTAISVEQYNATLRFQLGLLYYDKSKFAEAIDSFENALILDSNFENAKYFLGLSYYGNNRNQDAVKIFEYLQQRYPDNSEIKTILTNMKLGTDAFSGITQSNSQLENREDLPVEDSKSE